MDEKDDDAKVDSDTCAGLHFDNADTAESLNTFLCNLVSARQLAAITRLIIVGYDRRAKMILCTDATM